MPASWVSAGLGVAGLLTSNSGESSSQVADPYQNYRQASGQVLSGQAANNVYGSGLSGTSTLSGLNNYVNNNTSSLTSALSNTGTQLANLIANPASALQSASYQSALNQGLSATNTGLAASGLNGSGNQLAALQNYATSSANSQYNTQVSQLSSLYNQALSANQQMFNQSSGLNTQSYNQLAQLSGASSGNTSSAAQQLAAQNTANANAASSIANSLYSGYQNSFGSFAQAPSSTGSPYYSGTEAADEGSA